MKFLTICKCCDTVLAEVEIPPHPSCAAPSMLTGVVGVDIIETDGPPVVYVTTLCDECREALYGREGNFYGGPVWH